jgi:DNA polymerase-4
VRSTPTVLHLDLDAFFAAVEQRDKPSLRGKPVVVGGTGWRGVVATASYEARVFGVGSAMPTAMARRRCLNAAYLAPRFSAYRVASQQVMELLHGLSPLVEPLSLDEAYVDLAPGHPDLDVETARELVQEFRDTVRRVTGLTASVGVGTSKLVAKIGSDLDKPDGLRIVPPGEEAAVLAPLPVRRLPGVGPVTEERLVRRGLTTIGALAGTELSEVVELVGRANGTGLHAYAHGVDPRPVVPERDAKSVSAEETFSRDLTDRRALEDQARRLAERVADRLGRDGLSGRTVTIKVRRFDFTTLNRSATTPHPVDDVRAITASAIALLRQVDVADGVRLLGVGVSALSDYAQQDLLAGVDLTSGAAPRAGASPGPSEEVIGEAYGDAAPAASPLVADPGEDRSAVLYGPDDGPAAPVWRPGQDVHHAELGPGWVQGSGVGRVTVRFEGPHTAVGPIRSYRVEDPDLTAAEPPVW